MLSRKSLPVKVFAAWAAVSATALATPAIASAAAVEPALVHASPNNGCKLNVRAGTAVTAALLHTLTCANYTTCAHAEAGQPPCGPYLTGGTYTCVGPDGKQVTDTRWAEVVWRAPQTAYVSVACSAFRS
ncbi:hypothetical protein [Amycolatopsis anabasis]|uniref:hypothetical protein n=1 Tax=Amycolatopsis anabasis TaxID=1840409 RepID=UPI001FEC938F|nr:hypothetical protein [Amycolatopsis anabasis]